ncbi:GTPase HflX [Candidatus Roizmanbacteria bacterium RIFCSPHIGHO2_02_FULL_37_15]|nr:MAG: GTPase HflX [Candidatus Roizmanbacteria bacterium RIFCSPHIGHO2_01_FULL_37_16b]OGK22085.1 MAG: GTPase HflX [Candidatus Roizmanbacteria bacterium RIFCSPHIGHO2_02_FULL_37_15]OGK33183.1 MAG: GTPase HflX [Candidatus Roizmanbacteria bacterium RIFCSPHIGHO2_12_FULL_36_11]
MSELRVVLIDVISPHKHSSDALKDLAELQLLVKTFGGVDIVQIIQHRTAPDQATFIGSGKVQELILIVKQEKISHLIINSIVSPGQIFNLTKILWSVNPNIQVWDRVDLILNIFEKHARSAEAKLQIEIARMQHMKFRIYGLGGTVLSRQAGGIGTRGIGETNIERMRQHFKKQIKKKKEQLEKLVAHHQRQFLRRQENGIKTISIIGYTNAGKTSLFNLLTGKNKQVEDALFVTLDSSVGSLMKQNPQGSWNPEGSENVVISDTIGFIQNLPPSLIESFKSTLLEAIEADILLHIIDLSDEKMEEKIKAVEVITNDLNLSTKKQFYVFNKLDRLNGKVNTIVPKLQEKYLDFSPLFISVKTSEGIEQLKKQLLQVI